MVLVVAVLVISHHVLIKLTSRSPIFFPTVLSQFMVNSVYTWMNLPVHRPLVSLNVSRLTSLFFFTMAVPTLCWYQIFINPSSSLFCPFDYLSCSRTPAIRLHQHSDPFIGHALLLSFHPVSVLHVFKKYLLDTSYVPCFILSGRDRKSLPSCCF